MKKWLMMLAVLVTFCLVGCGEKPMTAVYFQADDNSWYFADLDTGTIFSGTIPDKLTDENGKKLCFFIVRTLSWSRKRWQRLSIR